MQTPEGTIDFIGTTMQLGLGVIDLVKTFAPTPDQRAENQKQHKKTVAIRRLRHKWKDVAVATYVKSNFPEYTEEERTAFIAELQALLKRI